MNRRTLIATGVFAVTNRWFAQIEESIRNLDSRLRDLANQEVHIPSLRALFGQSSPGYDSDLVMEKAGEQSLRMRRTDFANRPQFHIGRIQVGGDGAYNVRILYSDDVNGERHVTIIDQTGIHASVRQFGGVHYEGFIDGDTYPKFRIHSNGDGGGWTQYELGPGGDTNDTDIRIRRVSATELAIIIGNPPTHVVSFTPGATFLTGNMVMQNGFISLQERADPGAAGANQAWLFARDNGAGKTQVCVRFPSGAVQVLATEP